MTVCLSVYFFVCMEHYSCLDIPQKMSLSPTLIPSKFETELDYQRDTKNNPDFSINLQLCVLAEACILQVLLL